MPDAAPSRFLTIDELADELAISRAQAYALIRRKDIPALKIGGRGQWRIERDKVEEYIERTYTETATWIDEHPFAEGSQEPDLG